MVQDNLAVAQRWFEEVWNLRRADTISALTTPASLGHDAEGSQLSPEEFRRVHAEFLAAFPDLEISVEEALAEGELVAVRWRAAGRHLGDGFGLRATGLAVSLLGTTWFRIRDGLILEAWDCWNRGALFQRLRDASVSV